MKNWLGAARSRGYAEVEQSNGAHPFDEFVITSASRTNPLQYRDAALRTDCAYPHSRYRRNLFGESVCAWQMDGHVNTANQGDRAEARRSPAIVTS